MHAVAIMKPHQRLFAALNAPVIAMVMGLAPAGSMGHGGGLNAQGCHNNRKTGDYHCHRAPAAAPADQSPASRPSAPGGTRPLAPSSSPSGRPTCYVGPRGGTYTITPSGRKNYSGC